MLVEPTLNTLASLMMEDISLTGAIYNPISYWGYKPGVKKTRYLMSKEGHRLAGTGVNNYLDKQLLKLKLLTDIKVDQHLLLPTSSDFLLDNLNQYIPGIIVQEIN